VKRVGVILILAIAAMSFSRTASASGITFNEAGLVPGVGPDPFFPGSQKGTRLTNQLASAGVLFSIDDDGAAYISNDFMMGAAGSPSMESNYLVVNSLPTSLGLLSTTLHLTFVDPLTGLATTAGGISMVVSDWNATPDPRVIVNAFDALGNLVETHNLYSYVATLAFEDSSIARLDFVDNGGDGHIVDNLVFSLNSDQANPNQVPEPGTLLLVLAGVTGVARRRWRA
jgi:hypothetical protein